MISNSSSNQRLMGIKRSDRQITGFFASKAARAIYVTDVERFIRQPKHLMDPFRGLFPPVGRRQITPQRQLMQDLVSFACQTHVPLGCKLKRQRSDRFMAVRDDGFIHSFFSGT